MAPELSIIIVNWNAGPLLEENIRSLVTANKLNGIEILVVDNGSSDGSADFLTDDHRARRLNLGENRGFAAAVNAGVAATTAPWILLLNPDLTHHRDNLQQLRSGIAACPGAAGLAGRLVDPSGRPQQPFQLRRLPGPAWALAELFLPPTLRRRLPVYRRHHYLDADPERPFAVEQPAAACLLLRRTVFDAVGRFDEAFFPAWFEDVDLARRLHDAGHRLWYWPSAEFVHRGGYSVDHLGRPAFLASYWRNARRYYRKHHPVFGGIYTLLLPVGALCRLVAALPRPAERSGWWRVLGMALGGGGGAS